MIEYTIYGKKNCPYCDKAKELLDSKGIEYEYFDVMLDLARRTEMMTRVNRPVTTVPQIMKGEHYVGGYTDLLASFS
jgi:glutaredoxin